MRARTRGTRGGESTARLAPSRQLEHSRPLRVLRVRSFVRYRRDTIFSFSLLLRALCSPRRACAPFFTSPSSSSRRWRVEREKERERFDSFPLFFSFFPLLRSMRRDRDILIVGKYYENRIKIEFEKEDGAREAKFYTYERLSNYLDNRFHGIKCREARIKEATSLSVPAIPVVAFR